MVFSNYLLFCLCGLSWIYLVSVSIILLKRAPSKRERLIEAALTGLLADPEDHADLCKDGESCQQAVARLAVEQADETLKQLKK